MGDGRAMGVQCSSAHQLPALSGHSSRLPDLLMAVGRPPSKMKNLQQAKQKAAGRNPQSAMWEWLTIH